MDNISLFYFSRMPSCSVCRITMVSESRQEVTWAARQEKDWICLHGVYTWGEYLNLCVFLSCLFFFLLGDSNQAFILERGFAKRKIFIWLGKNTKLCFQSDAWERVSGMSASCQGGLIPLRPLLWAPFLALHFDDSSCHAGSWLAVKRDSTCDNHWKSWRKQSSS